MSKPKYRTVLFICSDDTHRMYYVERRLHLRPDDDDPGQYIAYIHDIEDEFVKLKVDHAEVKYWINIIYAVPTSKTMSVFRLVKEKERRDA